MAQFPGPVSRSAPSARPLGPLAFIWGVDPARFSEPFERWSETLPALMACGFPLGRSNRLPVGFLVAGRKPGAEIVMSSVDAHLLIYYPYAGVLVLRRRELLLELFQHVRSLRKQLA